MANPSRLVLDKQIVMPRGELQVHVAKDTGILRDEPLVYFLLACGVFSSAVQFFLRWLLIIFSNVNYFDLSLVKFFIGSPNEFFSLVLQIIFD